ncbi:Hypothetical predicted protein [Cloeon dipterum]|uniref:Yippee domain-containing protein n=2 Tax=Baetidae TaxID=172515 RepID=A0A8S1E5M6_9INSE|nr:Hypothetical predicted protein [Cloeon dipterum]
MPIDYCDYNNPVFCCFRLGQPCSTHYNWLQKSLYLKVSRSQSWPTELERPSSPPQQPPLQQPQQQTQQPTRMMVKTFQAYLPSCHRTYSCVHCRAHLANHDELISKSFQGSQGRAYLFNSVVNVGCGPAEERVLLTGLHAVADIYCECCKTTLGWKYEHAFELSQKYKEGKYIIELAHMIKENGWD